MGTNNQPGNALHRLPPCLASWKRNTPEQSYLVLLLSNCFLEFLGNFYEKKFPTPPSSCRQHLISGRKRQSQHVLFSHYPWKFAKEKTWEFFFLTFLKPLKHTGLIPHLACISRLKDIVSHSRLLLKLFKRGGECNICTYDCGCSQAIYLSCVIP